MSDTVFLTTPTKVEPHDGDLWTAILRAERIRAKTGKRVTVSLGAEHIATFLSPAEIMEGSR